MKTTITDKTLSYFPYSDDISAEEIAAYADSIFLCGADYVEIDRHTAQLLKDRDLSEKYILNVKEVSDIELLKKKSFAYAVIPLGMAEHLKDIPAEQPAAIEINADEYSAQALLLYAQRFCGMPGVSLIRLTGAFADNGEDLSALISWHHANSFIPLDICPLNTMMTGVSDAMTAYSSGADMITLSFGRGYYYSALEQFMVNLHILKRSIMKTELIKGLCAASIIFSDMFGAIPTGLERMLDNTGDIAATVHDIESGVSYRPFRLLRRKAPPVYENALDRKIKSIGLEREIEDAIIDMLKKVNFRFYKDITKRNPV